MGTTGNGLWYFDNISITPEPASLVLVALGGSTLFWRRMR
ncbi:MAG: PEP-CTERM sorting domain-containing protein [Candidatus Pacebacteria bacterium]|nr:PEP-CTERM sorting domain-containing protein [Candidatus Paceibacterota bacterium]